MMPSKENRADEYYSKMRDFASLRNSLSRTFLGGTLKIISIRDISMGSYTTKDVIATSPANFIDPTSSVNPYRYTSSGLGAKPVIYNSHMSGAAGLLQYSRKSTGLILGGYTSYKKVGTGNGGNYKHVFAIGDYIGGNIKSRQATLKWIGGMWREKK